MLILLVALAVGGPSVLELAGDDGLECDRICRTLGRGDSTRGGPFTSELRGTVLISNNFSLRFALVAGSVSALPTLAKDGQDDDFVGLTFVIASGADCRVAGRCADAASGNPSRTSSKREVSVDELEAAGENSMGGSGSRFDGGSYSEVMIQDRFRISLLPMTTSIRTHGNDWR